VKLLLTKVQTLAIEVSLMGRRGEIGRKSKVNHFKITLSDKEKLLMRLMPGANSTKLFTMVIIS
jgi:hypothetical protein